MSRLRIVDSPPPPPAPPHGLLAKSVRAENMKDGVTTPRALVSESEKEDVALYVEENDKSSSSPL